jgi:hypothetical protein
MRAITMLPPALPSAQLFRESQCIVPSSRLWCVHTALSNSAYATLHTLTTRAWLQLTVLVASRRFIQARSPRKYFGMPREGCRMHRPHSDSWADPGACGSHIRHHYLAAAAGQ